jgi:hypothetical protein
MMKCIDALNRKSDPRAVKDIIDYLAKSDADRTDQEWALNKIREKTGLGKKALGLSLKERKRTNRGSSESTDAEKYLKKLDKLFGGKYQLPPDNLGPFEFEEIDGKIWLSKLTFNEQTDEMESRRLCTPFMLVGGRIFVDRDEARGMKLLILTAEQKIKEVDFNAGLMARETDLVQRLLDGGMAIAPDGGRFLADYLKQAQPRGIKVYHQTGFRNGAFVCPTGEILLSDAEIELHADVQLKCEAKKGSLDEWCKATAELFKLKNAVPRHMAVLMGLAGTLANLLATPTLFYGLLGESSTGKSDAEGLAVAHWADPTLNAGLFVQMSGTVNSNEVALERASGTVIAFDEGTRSSNAKELENFVFAVEGGGGKRRLNRDASEKRSRRWIGGTVIISTEVGIAEKMQSENVTHSGGLTVRAFGVQSTKACRIADLGITARMAANFGWSGPAFVQALADQGYVAEPERLKMLIEDRRGALKNTEGTENAMRRRAARMPAYLWAAADIAIKAGLIPPAYNVREAIEGVWEQFLASELSPVDPAVRATETLFNYLIANRGVTVWSLVDGEGSGHREAVAYYDADFPGELCYVVRADKITELAGGIVSKARLLEYLESLDVQGGTPRKALARQKAKDGGDGKRRTWNGCPGLGKDAQYVVIRSAAIEA